MENQENNEFVTNQSSTSTQVINDSEILLYINNGIKNCFVFDYVIFYEIIHMYFFKLYQSDKNYIENEINKLLHFKQDIFVNNLYNNITISHIDVLNSVNKIHDGNLNNIKKIKQCLFFYLLKHPITMLCDKKQEYIFSRCIFTSEISQKQYKVDDYTVLINFVNENIEKTMFDDIMKKCEFNLNWKPEPYNGVFKQFLFEKNHTPEMNIKNNLILPNYKYYEYLLNELINIFVKKNYVNVDANNFLFDKHTYSIYSKLYDIYQIYYLADRVLTNDDNTLIDNYVNNIWEFISINQTYDTKNFIINFSSYVTNGLQYMLLGLNDEKELYLNQYLENESEFTNNILMNEITNNILINELKTIMPNFDIVINRSNNTYNHTFIDIMFVQQRIVKSMFHIAFHGNKNINANELADNDEDIKNAPTHVYYCVFNSNYDYSYVINNPRKLIYRVSFCKKIFLQSNFKFLNISELEQTFIKKLIIGYKSLKDAKFFGSILQFNVNDKNVSDLKKYNIKEIHIKHENLNSKKCQYHNDNDLKINNMFNHVLKYINKNISSKLYKYNNEQYNEQLNKYLINKNITFENYYKFI
jgi:hypothetical protein